jgi:transcriptional regulator with XRE-family HTH domain
MTDGPSGDELRERREALGLTQDEAARAVGMTSNTLSRWERGERGNPHAVDRLLRFYEDGGQVAPVTSRGDEAGGERVAAGNSPRTRFLVSDLLRVVAELVELEAGARGVRRTPSALDAVPLEELNEEDVTPRPRPARKRPAGGAG